MVIQVTLFCILNDQSFIIPHYWDNKEMSLDTGIQLVLNQFVLTLAFMRAIPDFTITQGVPTFEIDYCDPKSS